MQLKRALTYPLRLCPSIRGQAESLARQEGISLNHFISLAVAEKLSRLEHENWLKTQNLKSPDTFHVPYLRSIAKHPRM